MPLPTVKQMEALVWIARLGSFERAAARLNTSQSAISKRVKELENACGVSVFDRSGRDARLTDEGRRLLLIGEDMLRLAAEAADVQRSKDAPSGTLRLGVTEFTALTWLPKFAAGLRDQFPDTAIHLRVEMSQTLSELLSDDEIDFAVMPDDFGHPEQTSTPLASLDHAWLGCGSIASAQPTIVDLGRLTLLIQGKRSATTHATERWLKAQGVKPKSRLVCDNLIAQLGLAIAGAGVCCLPIPSLQPLFRSRKLRILEHLEAPSPITYVARFREAQKSSFLRHVTELAQENCDFTRQFILRP
jgi:DNA-binding transcriptional LysR family regulator